MYLEQICYLILLFFVYSAAGWCIEVVLKYIQYHRFINRGFLQGPYCPIYGSGVVFITVSVRLLSGLETSVGTTFVISFIACGMLEYLVSYYMEKKFHARWWDYSQKPMNLNGRIWIGNLFLFGIGGTLIIEVLNPIAYSLFERMSQTALVLSSLIVAAIFITDFTFSHFIMKLVKVGVENSQADNTEDVSEEIRELMTNKSLFHSRLVKAYPEVVYYTDRIEQKKREREQKINQLRRELSHEYSLFMSNPLNLRDEVIRLQEELILTLVTDSNNGERIRKLTDDLEAAKQKVAEQNKFFGIKS